MSQLLLFQAATSFFQTTAPCSKKCACNAFPLYKTVTSCTCSPLSSEPSAKAAKSRRPTSFSFLNQQPLLKNASRYIDPSYMVRSVAADTKDSHMCYLLASQVQCCEIFRTGILFQMRIINARFKVVHGAMHGFTQFRFGAIFFAPQRSLPCAIVSRFTSSTFCQCVPREQQNGVC
jgi:hypothetical protein